MNKRLIIIGAGGHGRVLANIAVMTRKWDTISFLDDGNDCLKNFGQIEIIGNTHDLHDYIEDTDFIVGIGDNYVRSKFHERLESVGASIATLIHPYSSIGMYVEIGMGTVIMPGVVVNCGSKIGRGCIINTSATIDHDNVLEEFVHVSPGVHLSGTVNVCVGTWIGTGVVIGNNVNILGGSVEKAVVIGVGTVVVKDIYESGIYVGVPAKRIK